MLKPLKECEWTPKWRVKIRKVWNVRQAELNDHFTVFQDGDRARLINDMDKFIKSMIETEKTEVKIERKPREKKYYKPEKTDFIDNDD